MVPKKKRCNELLPKMVTAHLPFFLFLFISFPLPPRPPPILSQVLWCQRVEGFCFQRAACGSGVTDSWLLLQGIVHSEQGGSDLSDHRAERGGEHATVITLTPLFVYSASNGDTHLYCSLPLENKAQSWTLYSGWTLTDVYWSQCPSGGSLLLCFSIHKESISSNSSQRHSNSFPPPCHIHISPFCHGRALVLFSPQLPFGALRRVSFFFSGVTAIRRRNNLQTFPSLGESGSKYTF